MMSPPPLVPEVPKVGALSALVALVTLLSLIAAGVALWLTPAAFALGTGVERRVSVQLLGEHGDRATERSRVTARLRELPSVAAIRVVPDAEGRALVSRWLGSGRNGEAIAGVALPTLIDVTLHPGASVAPLQGAVRAIAPDARIVPVARWLGPVAGLMRSVGLGAALAALALAAAAAAASVMGVRAVLARERETIATLHLVGATDVQIARLFTRAVMGAIGVGVVAGTAAASLLLVAGAPGLAASAAGLGLDMGGAAMTRWFALVPLPLLIASAGALAARFAVLRELRAMP